MNPIFLRHLLAERRDLLVVTIQRRMMPMRGSTAVLFSN